MELREHRRQQDRRDARRRTDREPPALEAREAGDLGTGGVEVGEHAFGPGEQDRPGVGQGDPPGAPLEEGSPDLGLELPDLLAHRGLGDPEVRGGAGEVPMLGDRGEVAQLVQLHRSSLLIVIASGYQGECGHDFAIWSAAA